MFGRRARLDDIVVGTPSSFGPRLRRVLRAMVHFDVTADEAVSSSASFPGDLGVSHVNLEIRKPVRAIK
ncbi:hypothetical protein MRX96_007968 [Rhipicephalus microplus]